MTRRYFTKAVAPAPKPRKVHPDHRDKAVIARFAGSDQTRFMSSREAALQMGRSKGGQVSAAKGVAHRFTSAEASKAAKKLWRTRWRFNRRIGTRIGWPAKLTTPLRRAPLRERHRRPLELVPGTFWQAFEWITVHPDGEITFCSERVALRRLGYLPYTRKAPVPISVTPAPLIRGKGNAAKRPKWSVQLTFHPQRQK